METRKTEDESALIEKAKAGDSESIDKLITSYKFLVRKIARTKFFLASGGDVEDLVQEGTLGLLKAVREYNSAKTKGGFPSFAAVCIQSKITDAMRSYSREKHKALNTASNIFAGEKEEEYLVDSVTPLPSDPLTSYIDEEERRLFYEKINLLLSRRQSQVIKLYLEGYSYKEIAAKLDIGSKTVDNVIAAAKDKIKKSKSIFK